VFAAPAKWLEYPPPEERCLGRDGQPDQPGDGQEVQKPQDVDVGLVDGIDLPGDPGRDQLFQRIIVPGQGDNGREQQVKNGQRTTAGSTKGKNASRTM